LYQSYACQTSEPNSTYLNIGDVYLSVTASSGGQVTYWLEGTDIDNMGSLADHHTVTVPSGTWNTTLNTLNGPYSGPHQLYGDCRHLWRWNGFGTRSDAVGGKHLVQPMGCGAGSR